jgi:hypothetical protein
MNILRALVSVSLFLVLCFAGYEVLTVSRRNQMVKVDYAEFHHFKHGLFSVNAWKRQLATIVNDEVEELSLLRKNETFVRGQLERQLGVLIDQIVARIRKKNLEAPHGLLKQGLLEAFVDVKDIKKGIPSYVEAMLAEMKRSGTERKMKGIVKDRLEDYLARSFDVGETAAKDRIMRKLAAVDEESASRRLRARLGENGLRIRNFAAVAVLAALALFLLEAFRRGPLLQLQFYLLTGALLVLLAGGVATPMIDMEAKIAELRFVLLGHEVSFRDQVLYFQSKSILDVFRFMITHRALEMKFVGILLVTFSVVFPAFKLLSSLAYYYDYCQARRYWLIGFFVLRAGKWSMADVLVVALFMAYVGFNGIIDAQLARLGAPGTPVNVLTTNGTSLRPGFYLFLTYTLLALVLARFLKNRPYE